MVEDGALVLDVFVKSVPDIFILDIMFPNRDEYSIAREIRKLKPAVPLIFLAAKTQTADLLKGFELGGNDYNRKPFSLKELVVRVYNLLQLATKSKAAGKKEIIIGKYRFTPHRQELWIKETSSRLSSRELVLVEMLDQYRNTILLRKDILPWLWGDISIFISRNLDVYITRLRKYFSEDDTVNIIKVKGIGYLFTSDSL
jgi:DNA-binding response OmpR family regulator